MPSFRSFTYGIIFLLTLITGRHYNVIAFLRDHYNPDHVKCYRQLENESKRLQKTELDLLFLRKCKVYNVMPKFLRFKLYKKSLNSSGFYKEWQAKLLDLEIAEKTKLLATHKASVVSSSSAFFVMLNGLDCFLVRKSLQKNIESYRENIMRTHCKKLKHLSIDNDLEPCDPKKVVHNYSSVIISSRLRMLLAFGLDFKLPKFKINFHQFFGSIEQIAYRLSNETCAPGKNFNNFIEKLQFISKKYFFEFNPLKIHSPIFSKDDIDMLKNFGKRPDIFVSSPDKGNGVVIVDKPTYLNSMYAIINDSTKFKAITERIELFCLHVEDKINSFLLRMKKSGTLDESIYKKLYVTGTGPGILYGKPKIHKSDFSQKFQFRPILAAYNQASYKIAKFLVPILAPLTSNEYTIINSAEFTKKIQNIENVGKYYMASFDIDSLFTNIPLRETIKICCEGMFQNCPEVHGFNKKDFGKLLELASLNSFFLFDGHYYQQTEGLGMGIPLGPTFANIFMCHHETTWMDECPLSFKPAYYFRYLDDTFLLFRDKNQCNSFFKFVNSKHKNIRFTVEHENDDSLSFLDVNLKRNNGELLSTVFRKPTFTGLGTSFFSFCCLKFKTNAIQTLLHRGFNICSTAFSFKKEVDFLKKFFHENGFPRSLIERKIETFLSKKLDVHIPNVTVNPKPFYYKLQFYGQESVLFDIEISKLISEFFYHIKPIGVLINTYSIGNFFKMKDTLPKSLCACVIYKYSCPKENCGSVYIGSTIRTLLTRANEHRGLSTRTGRPLASPAHSAVREHSEQCSGDVNLSDFSILGQMRASFDYELRLAESIHIIKERPDLNDMKSAFPLKIVK